MIFIYTCPPGAKVKERMLYAASKIALLSGAKADIGLNVEKRVSPFPPLLPLPSSIFPAVNYPNWSPE